MDGASKSKTTGRLAPLPADAVPEVQAALEATAKNLGFVPNSLLIMQRVPHLVIAFSQLTGAVNRPDGKVDRKLKRLIAHVASRAAGCQYCMAHTIEGAHLFGVDDDKLNAIWEYQTSPLYTPAERVALDFAIAGAQQPNTVDDTDFDQLRQHWSEEQIVEIGAVIALFGFLNRWNDTMGTPLEEAPIAAGQKYLARGGWTPGKHKS